jgi:hypothetical protein
VWGCPALTDRADNSAYRAAEAARTPPRTSSPSSTAPRSCRRAYARPGDGLPGCRRRHQPASFTRCVAPASNTRASLVGADYSSVLARQHVDTSWGYRRVGLICGHRGARPSGSVTGLGGGAAVRQRGYELLLSDQLNGAVIVAFASGEPGADELGGVGAVGFRAGWADRDTPVPARQVDHLVRGVAGVEDVEDLAGVGVDVADDPAEPNGADTVSSGERAGEPLVVIVAGGAVEQFMFESPRTRPGPRARCVWDEGLGPAPGCSCRWVLLPLSGRTAGVLW